MTRSLLADATAKLCPSGVGLDVETSVDVDGEAVAIYSQSTLRREHRVQLGRNSSHFLESIYGVPSTKKNTSSAYLDSSLLAC